MKLTRFILILIAGLAIIGLNTTGSALEEIDRPDYMVEEFEPEAESMEEDEYLVDEETVKPVKGEGWDEHDIPELY